MRFGRVLYYSTFQNDCRWLISVLLCLVLFVILIGIYYLVFRGFNRFLNSKAAYIVSAVLCLSGIALMYNYNYDNDYIKEAEAIIKEAWGIVPKKAPKSRILRWLGFGASDGKVVEKMLQKGESLDTIRSYVRLMEADKSIERALKEAKTPKEMRAAERRLQNASKNMDDPEVVRYLEALAAQKGKEMQLKVQRAKHDAEARKRMDAEEAEMAKADAEMKAALEAEQEATKQNAKPTTFQEKIPDDTPPSDAYKAMETKVDAAFDNIRSKSDIDIAANYAESSIPISKLSDTEAAKLREHIQSVKKTKLEELNKSTTPEQPAAQPKAPEPVAEPVATKDPAPETAKLPGAKTTQPEAPPPNPSATKTPSGRPSRPQNVTTIPELIRDKAVSSLLGLRERLLSSVPKNFSELKHGFQEYLENMRNPNLGSLELYKAQQKLLANRAKQLRTELKLDENGNYLIPGITPSKPKPEPVLKATYPTPEASGDLGQQRLIPFNEPIKGLDRLLETKPKPIPETNVSELKVNNPDQLGLDSMRGSSVDPIKTKVDPDGQVAFEWANPRTEPKEPVLKISPAPENPNRDLGQQLHISWNKPIQGLGDNFLKPEPKHLRDGQYVFDWYSKPMNPLAFIRKLLKRTPKTEAVERIPDHPDQLKFDFMAEPGGGKNTKKPALRGLWTDDFWNKGKAKIEAKAKAEAAAKAKEQAKAEAAANERLRENYGPEENELFGSNRPNEPRIDTQATKPGTGSASPEGTVNPGTASQAGAQRTGAAMPDFVKAMLNPKENGKQVFHGVKTIAWDPIFHPLKTVGRAAKGATGAALGATSAATMMNAGLNLAENGQPVGWWDMIKNIPQKLYGQVAGEEGSIPERTTIHPSPNETENNNKDTSVNESNETSTDDRNKEDAADANQNKGTIVTSFLPEKLKNISVNGYPVGGSLFGALAGGALGAGFGGLNYILTDDNELSEEEKKKRSLARAMLSSAGIGAGIGGAIGGLDDWGRSSTPTSNT